MVLRHSTSNLLITNQFSSSLAPPFPAGITSTKILSSCQKQVFWQTICRRAEACQAHLQSQLCRWDQDVGIDTRNRWITSMWSHLSIGPRSWCLEREEREEKPWRCFSYLSPLSAACNLPELPGHLSILGHLPLSIHLPSVPPSNVDINSI